MCVQLDLAACVRMCVVHGYLQVVPPRNKNSINRINRIQISSLFPGRSGDYLTRKINFFPESGYVTLSKSALSKLIFTFIFKQKSVLLRDGAMKDSAGGLGKQSKRITKKVEYI